MQKDDARRFTDMYCLYDRGDSRFYFLPEADHRAIFAKHRGPRDRTDRVSDHRHQLRVRRVLADNARVFSGYRQGRDQPYALTYAADILPAAELLAVLFDRTELRVAGFSRFGNAGRRNRTSSVFYTGTEMG